MKAITIHGLEDSVWAVLRERAKERGCSVNAMVKAILEQSLGVRRPRQQPHRQEFEEFCGMWSEQEYEEFREATSDDRRVEPEEWR